MRTKTRGYIKEIYEVKNLTGVDIQQFVFTEPEYRCPMSNKLISKEASFMIQALDDKIEKLRRFKPGDHVEMHLWINGVETLTPSGNVIYKSCLRLKHIEKVKAYTY